MKIGKAGNLFYELMSVQVNDRIIEIGFGTGKLIRKMAKHIDSGLIEGVDLSSTMVSIAQKRNKNDIAEGKVKIIESNFDEILYEKDWFTMACSINTLYFWSITTVANFSNLLFVLIVNPTIYGITAAYSCSLPDFNFIPRCKALYGQNRNSQQTAGRRFSPPEETSNEMAQTCLKPPHTLKDHIILHKTAF